MKVKVCMGSKCLLVGAMNIYEQLESLQEMIEEHPLEFTEEKLELEAIHCSGECKKGKRVAPIVIIEGEIIYRASSQMVMEKVMKSLALEHEM